MTLTHCPVRLFTPEVSAAFDLFYQTHALEAPGIWRRVSLPAPGGIGQQPARELAAITWIARVWNSRLGERRQRHADGGRR